MSRYATAVFLFVISTVFLPGAERRLSFRPAIEVAPVAAVSKQASDAPDQAAFESNSSGCWVDSVKLNGIDYQQLRLDGGATGGDVGKPQLPYHGRFIQVPSAKDVRLVIDRIEWVELDGSYDVAPRQADAPELVGSTPPPFQKDAATYNTDDFYPSAPVRIADKMRVRGRSFIYVIYSPLAHNPKQKKLKAARRVQWHLEFAAQEAAAAAPRLNVSRDSKGQKLFNSFFSSTLDARPAGETVEVAAAADLATTDGADYLVITPAAYSAAITPLANWKHRKGYRTRIVTTESIATNATADQIATYITSAYNNWNPAPSFVLLVGDADDIPPHYRNTHPYYGTSTATDLYYAAVDGSDIFPDLFVGRIPCQSASECTTIVNKILKVDQNPQMTTTSAYTNMMVAGYFQDDEPNGRETRLFLETCEAVKDYFETKGTQTVSTAYVDGSPAYSSKTYNSSSLMHTNGAAYGGTVTYVEEATATANITTAINNGISILQHRDHGYKFGWGDPPYSTSNVNALTNGDMYPVVFTINCETGWFDYSSDSFAEAWIKKSTGGSHSVVGASRVSYSWWNDWLVHGIYQSMYPDYLTTLSGIAHYKSNTYSGNFVGEGKHMGQILNYAKMMMYDKLAGGSQGGTCLVEFEIFHLFGDPEQMPRDEVPRTLVVSHPSNLTHGVPASFNVTVTSDGSPEEGALVTLVGGSADFFTATTNSSGVASFSITPLSAGTMMVTVSEQNCIPYQGSLAVAEPTREIVMINPNGGQTYSLSNTISLQWSAVGSAWSGGDKIALEYSTDGGSNWAAITGAASLDYDATSFSWEPSALAAGTEYRIRASWTGDANVNDTSDADFALEEPTLVYDFGTISSPQGLNTPFSVTISSQDDEGDAFPANTTVNLSAMAWGGAAIAITEINTGSPDSIEIQNVTGSTVDTTGWVVAVSDSYSAANSANATLWSLPNSMTAGQILYKTDSSLDQYWGANIYWNGGSNGWAMIIDDKGRVRDFVAWGWSSSDISSMNPTINGFSISIGSRWSGDGVSATGTGTIQRTGTTDSGTSSDFSYATASLDTQNTGLTVPMTGTTAAITMTPTTAALTSGTWTGNVTIPSTASGVVITATNASGSGDSNSFDVQLLSVITMSVTSAATEGDGVLSNQGTVSVPANLGSDLTVNLSSSDTSEVTVPASVTITAGTRQASFDLTVQDDGIYDSTQTVTITGASGGYTSGTDTIDVVDNEAVLTVMIPSNATEGDGALVNQGTVSLPGNAPSDTTVYLTSNDTSEVTVPASVTITAGTSSADFTLTVVDDSAIDGSQTVTITANGACCISGDDAITIADSEDTDLTLTLPASATEGDGVIASSASVSISGTLGTDLTVNLSSGDTTELSVPSTVTISAGETSATISLTIEDDVLIDGVQTVTVTAAATGFTSNNETMDIYDDESPTFSVSIPASAAEGDGILSGQGTVSIPGLLGTDVVANLSSSDTSEITVTSSVTISAGTSSATFDLTVLDDAVGDNTQTVTISAAASGWNTGTDTIEITDNDVEIDICGNSTSITCGDTTPSTSDHTDFQDVNTSEGTLARVYTIQNLGGATLSLSAPYVQISGANAADFTVTVQPSATISGGGSSTFVIQFDPSADGPRTATVTINCDDVDESAYTFNVQGTGYTSPPDTGSGGGCFVGTAGHWLPLFLILGLLVYRRATVVRHIETRW